MLHINSNKRMFELYKLADEGVPLEYRVVGSAGPTGMWFGASINGNKNGTISRGVEYRVKLLTIEEAADYHAKEIST